MADFRSELLGFGRKTLPSPYDTLTSKKVKGGSKYNPDPEPTRQSSLAGGFTAAITHIIATDIGENNKVAIGLCGTETTVCEYHSSVSDIVDIIVYDAESGDLAGSVYNASTASGDKYVLDKGEKNGNAIHGALFPTYYADDEFAENYDKLKEEAKAGYPDRTYASQLMGILNDNVYRRLKDDSIATHIKVTEPGGKKFALNLIRNAAFTSGTYDPHTVQIGKFEMLSGNTTTAAPGKASKTKYTKEDFIGKFRFNPSRVFTEEEKQMMESTKLDDYHILDDLDFKICNILQQTTGTNIPFRVLTFRGDAGSGKSARAKATANGLGLPIVIKTCSSNTEIFDFIGQVMPASNNKVPGACTNDALLDKLDSLGGITFENIAKALNLPTMSDIDFDPSLFFEDMTGSTVEVKEESGVETYIVDGKVIGEFKDMKRLAVNTWQEIMSKHFNEIINSIKQQNGDDTKFIYTETDFIRAIKYGWVVEIQEPNVILSEGVLVGLNGLLAEGKISLPTGEIIERHPDCVIIFTTNVTYNGCRAMNQSVIDRSNKVFDIETPTVEVMAERAMSLSGNDNEDDVLEMAQIVKDIASEMLSTGIDDGVCGMRSLANWALASRFEDPYEAFHDCVLSKTSMDEESRLTLKKRIDESKFKPVVKKKRI